MPMQAANNTDPGPRPSVMTWGKATPVLVIALIFYLLRLVFEQFWFFGPALLGLAAGAKYGSIAGGAVTAAVGVGEFFTGPVIEIFGVIMAMMVAVLGWGTIVLVIILTNGRLFKENAKGWLISLAGFGFSFIPIVGTVPSVLGTTIELYRQQIKCDKQKLRAWKAARKAYADQQRALQRAQAAEIAAQRAQEEGDAEAEEETTKQEFRVSAAFPGEYSYAPNFDAVANSNEIPADLESAT